MADQAAVIAQAFSALLGDQHQAAKALIRTHYPFAPQFKTKRQYSTVAMLGIFRRDGFIDRYAGTRLVFPGVLRLLSKALPEEFPYHPNWRMSVTHPAYWELMPTIDHIVPVSRGGEDVAANWVTTSQLRNNAKANWILAELRWTLYPAGDLAEWDGLMGPFCRLMAQDTTLQADPYLRRWYRAARLLAAQ